MIAATYGNVEDIEILWAFIALAGIIYSTINLREAVSDFRFVQERQISNGRRVLAQTHLISEALRLCILVIFLGLGLAAMTIPSPQFDSHTPHNVILISALVRWGLIVASTMLLVKTYMAKRARDALRIGGGTTITTKEGK